MKAKKNKVALLGVALLVTPLVVSATAVFQNPLYGSMGIDDFISNIIYFILTLMGLIGLLGLVYGGAMIVLGGMKSEQDLNRGKQIIFWALAGLLMVGMASAILNLLGGILGF